MANLNPIHIFFIFALGACIGSFLNVVVWRLPRVQLPEQGNMLSDMINSFRALSDPPSHCPNCNTRLKWYDNIPILGWIKLGGRCRFCKKPFSIRYPIVELLTALLFAGYFIAYFGYQIRSCCPQPLVVERTFDWQGIAHEITRSEWILSRDWPIFALYMAAIAGLLAASLIDAELYIIPLEIPWLLFILGLIVHTAFDHPTMPGALNLVGDYGPQSAALSAGASIGLAISMTLWARGILPTSFAKGEPLLRVDRDAMAEEMARAKKAGEPWEGGPLPPEYTTWQIRKEISKEMVFLLPPLICGGAMLAMYLWLPMLHDHWPGIVAAHHWLSGLLGSMLGAMVGAFVVWITRILGTLVFRKVAMGLGDVHLMLGVGAVIGAMGATIAFFIAPFVGMLWAFYMLIFRRGREIPYGPFLSLATAVVMLWYCSLMQRLEPGLQGMAFMIDQLLHG